MLLKIRKRTITIKNCMVFVVLSIAFLHIVKSLSVGTPSFGLNEVKLFAKSQFLLLEFMGVVLFSIYFARKFSRYIFPLYILVISALAFRYFLIDFNKVILLLDFVYLICGHYFVLLWFAELNDPIYNPGYSLFDIDKVQLNKIYTTVADGSGLIWKVELKNWGEQSCFVRFSDLNTELPSIKEIEFIEIQYKSLIIKERVSVYTQYNDGLGLKIHTFRNSLNKEWPNFYKLTKDRRLINSLSV